MSLDIAINYCRTNFPLLSEEGGLRACADGVVPPTSNYGTILRTCPYDDHAKRWTHCLDSALRLRSYYWLSGPPLLTHRCGLHHPGHSTNDCPSSERRGKFSATRARVLTTTKTRVLGIGDRYWGLGTNHCQLPTAYC